MTRLSVLWHISSIHANPTGESTSLNHPSSTDLGPLEERQALAGIAIGSFAAGIATGRISQALRSSSATTAGLNSGPGSACFKSGSWSYQAPVIAVVPFACNEITLRAVDFIKNKNTTQMNPNVVMLAFPNGSYLTNEAGYRQHITFGLYDQNGERGAPFTSQSACEMAMTAIMYDCSGSNSDTRGGVYFYGHDGVVGYVIDPTCVDR